MSAIPARRRRRLIAAVATSVASLLALPTGLVLGANALLNDAGGDKVDEVPAISVPASSLHLWAVVSARDELTAVALVALTPEGRGGTIISIPAGSAADVAATEAPRRIADSWTTGGLAALRTDVEDLLNVSLNSAQRFTSADLATLLAPVGPQPVTLPQDIWDGGGSVEAARVLPAGAATLSPAEIAAGLAAIEAAVAESYRLPQVKALWGAVARAGVEADVADAGGASTTTTTATPDASTVLTALLAGRVDLWQVSSSRLVDAQRNPAGLDLYALDGGEALMVLASTAPGALTLSNTNISLMIDTPFDDASFAREAVTRLAYLGANVVVLRRTLDPPQERTVVHYGDPLARTEVESYASLLGPLEFVETSVIIAGVDARIVLGHDFTSHLGAGGGTGATTTTVAR